MAAMGECALCMRQAQLCGSHIMPSFAARWLKNRYPGNRFRQATNPSLPQQDGPKLWLLCTDCEGRFSKWEKLFSEKIFVPFHETGQRCFKYEQWLIRFAVSLAWRVVVHGLRTDDGEVDPVLAGVVDYWQSYLLGDDDDADPGPYEHHMFFLPEFAALATAEVYGAMEQRRVSRHIRSSLDGDTPCVGASGVAVYTRLAGIAFWSHIAPPILQGWDGTLILRSGAIETSQWAPPEFWKYLRLRTEGAAQRMSTMSATQRRKISDSTARGG